MKKILITLSTVILIAFFVIFVAHAQNNTQDVKKKECTEVSKDCGKCPSAKECAKSEKKCDPAKCKEMGCDPAKCKEGCEHAKCKAECPKATAEAKSNCPSKCKMLTDK